MALLPESNNLPRGSHGEGGINSASLRPFVPLIPAPILSDETPQETQPTDEVKRPSFLAFGATFPEGIKLQARQFVPRLLPSDNLFERLLPQREAFKAISNEGPVVSMLHIEEEPHQDALHVHFDYTIGHYPLSRIFNTPHAEDVPKMAQVTGTDIIWHTTEPEGSLYPHLIPVQLRYKHNGYYGGTIGASAAGAWDSPSAEGKTKYEQYHDLTFRRHKEFGHLYDPTADMADNLRRETREELGIPEQILEKAHITPLAISKDPVIQHLDILATGTLPLTALEVQAYNKAEIAIAKHERRKGHYVDEVAFIPATPHAIVELVTKVASPLSPASRKNYIADGTRMIYKQFGGPSNHAYAERQALQWKDRTEKAMHAHYDVLDQTVREFYELHPDMRNHQKPGKPPRVTTGFDPNYLPEEQGLLSMEAALEQSSLLIPDSMLRSPQKSRRVIS